MENLDFILSLFNQYLFQDAKNNIESLKYYINTNQATRGNKLISELVNAINDYTLESIDRPLFESILSRCNKNAAEKQEIMQRVLTWKGYDKSQIAPASKYFKDVVSASVIQRANSLYSGSPSDYIKYLKDVNVNVSDADFFTVQRFKELDVNKIIADSNVSAVKTNFSWINSLWPAFGGIPFGQIVTITGVPGSGKSALSMDLASYFASQGYKCAYFCLGDMNMTDFITRMATTVFKVDFTYAYSNIAQVYNQLCSILGDNLFISINPAGTVTIDDIINNTIKENYDVIFVDYDENLALGSSGDDDSMYNTFGDIYAKTTKLSLMGKLVFMLSQPKVGSYTRIIGLGDLSASSRKVHCVDSIITLSKEVQECPNPVFLLSCCKNRRGRLGSCPVIRVQGKFVEIPYNLYQQLTAVREQKDYTFTDIDAMIHTANVSMNNINQQINNVIQQNKNTMSPRANPFSGMGI